jgi:hypothetical protein
VDIKLVDYNQEPCDFTPGFELIIKNSSKVKSKELISVNKGHW